MVLETARITLNECGFDFNPDVSQGDSNNYWGHGDPAW